MDFQILLRSVKNKQLQHAVRRWRLDTPKQLQTVESTTSQVKVAGWVLAENEEHSVKLLLRQNGIVTVLPLNRNRPRVITKILDETAEGHPRLCCGFDVSVTLDGTGFEIGFEIDGVPQWARVVEVRKAMKVLEGSGGHLFLSNDTNRSIDQYTGQYLIPPAELECWDAYLEKLGMIRRTHQAKMVFLAAPSKEYIFPEYYPFTPGKISPMIQLTKKFAEYNEHLVYPVEKLKACREISYARGDTHWTDYGGMIAAEAVLEAIGIDFDFSEVMPKFALRSVTGDLGSKITPPLRYPTYLAEFKAAGMSIGFNNGIDNHGRIWIFERENAPRGTVVVFGGSSSKNVVPWLSLVFKRVLYVHAAASIDPTILTQERPDVVILQTNSRFVVKAPQATLNTKNVIAKKVSALTPSDWERLSTVVHAQSEELYKGWMLELLEVGPIK